MKSSTVIDNTRLSEVLSKEIELFGKVLANCEEQAQLLKDDRIEELNTTSSKMDKLRDKINGLHQELGELMQSYSLEAAKSGVRDVDIDTAYAQLMDLIRQGALINEKNVALLQIKSQEQTKKIDKQRAQREGITGYAQSVVSNPEMYDRTT